MRELVDEVAGDLPEELAWQERALCAQTDPEAFFPEKGGSTREAKRVCMSCDVRAGVPVLCARERRAVRDLGRAVRARTAPGQEAAPSEQCDALRGAGAGGTTGNGPVRRRDASRRPRASRSADGARPLAHG